ncbi:hypothetical protein HK097_006144, partial [Rhizophlyctis rosea]
MTEIASDKSEQAEQLPVEEGRTNEDLDALGKQILEPIENLTAEAKELLPTESALVDAASAPEAGVPSVSAPTNEPTEKDSSSISPLTAPESNDEPPPLEDVESVASADDDIEEEGGVVHVPILPADKVQAPQSQIHNTPANDTANTITAIQPNTSSRTLTQQQHTRTTNTTPVKQSAPSIAYPYLYQLRAAVIHYGGHNSGHFVTFRRFTSSSKSAATSEPPQPDPVFLPSVSSLKFLNETQAELRRRRGNATAIPPTATRRDEEEEDQEEIDVWYRISDDRVDAVGDLEEVFESGFGGSSVVYMLYYER